MIVLKLGGSVITDKEKPMTAAIDNIRRLAEEIAATEPIKKIIVHGGGSFGHTIAEQFKIAEGHRFSNQIIGFAKTHQAMAILNNIIMDEMLSSGIPAITLAPSSFISTREGRITKVDLKVIKWAIEKKLIPVLYGDAVMDEVRGFSILSGDQISAYLAVQLKASRLILGVDVDGVYTSNPKLDPKSRLIQRLTPLNTRELVEIGPSHTPDVTGGMLGKVSEALAAVEAGIEVLIVNASRPGVILKALRGEPVTGTLMAR